MRIAMVSEHASPLATLGGADAGGQNVHVAALAEALATRGHDVTVYTRRDDPDLPARVRIGPGVTVRHVTAGPARAVPKDDLLPYMDEFGDRLHEDWAARPPGVVHAHFWMSGLAALLGVRGLPVPVAQTFHALGSVKRRHQGAADTSPLERRRLEPEVGRRATAIVATCSDEVHELAAMGVPLGRVHVVPCGVDVTEFRPEGPRSARGSGPRVLALGRMVPRKGLETVIEAMARLPGVRLDIVGGPPREQLDAHTEARRLREGAARCGVADRVHLHGRVARRDVPRCLRGADVVVSMPWYEPFGMVPLEAMACGVPVVASDVGGHRDTVDDQVTGVLVPPRRPGRLARVLGDLLEDPGRRAAMGVAAAEHARSFYGWARVAEETERIYHRLVADQPAAIGKGGRA